MSNNKKLNLTKDEDSIIGFIKKYKIYAIGFICFLTGFVVAPNGIDETEYRQSLEKVDKIEAELTDSKKLVTGLELQVKQAKVFLDLDRDSQNIIKANINEMKVKKEEEEERVKKEELEKKKAEEAAKEANVTNLFKEIYQNFAPNVGSTLYGGAKQVVLSSGYKCDIKEPTVDDVGKIKVYDRSSGDSVTLSFYPENDIEVLSLVQYDRNGNAIAVTDDFHTISARYSIYNGTNTTAYSIDEQKEFIFAQ